MRALAPACGCTQAHIAARASACTDPADQIEQEKVAAVSKPEAA